jgi:hypothetical protein
VFAPAAIARLGADSPADCLSELSQTEDAAWFLPYAGAMSTTTVGTFAACAALCGTDCQWVTFDYVSKSCSIKLYSAPELDG